MNLIPLDNWIILKARPPKTKAGSLVLPDGGETQKVFPLLADVIAAGPGRRNEAGDVIPMRIKVNDVVLINGVGVRGFNLDVTEVVWMAREHEIAALVEGAEAEETLSSIIPFTKGAN